MTFIKNCNLSHSQVWLLMLLFGISQMFFFSHVWKLDKPVSWQIMIFHIDHGHPYFFNQHIYDGYNSASIFHGHVIWGICFQRFASTRFEARFAWCNRFQATISGKDYKRFLIEEDPEECPVLLKEPWPRTWRTWSSGVMKPGKSPWPSHGGCAGKILEPGDLPGCASCKSSVVQNHWVA